jgi:hypothetical protein
MRQDCVCPQRFSSIRRMSFRVGLWDIDNDSPLVQVYQMDQSYQ